MTRRPPAVAGTFYPGEEHALLTTVDRLLGAAPPSDLRARAVVAPHAGYVYSGSTAAVAYRALGLDGVRRVAVLGPTHRVLVEGVALPASDTWSTPLGDLRVERPEAVVALPHVVVDDRPHAPEHSLEVHLPFLQRLLADPAVVPLAVGRATPEQVADVVEALLADEGTVVVVSSDLSHYLPYAEARRVDAATLAQVTALDGAVTHEQACGATPVNGLMAYARRTGQQLVELASCSSGDTAGDRCRVVGYAALALVPGQVTA